MIQAREAGDSGCEVYFARVEGSQSQICRPLRGLVVTWDRYLGFRYRYTPGFMLSRAPHA